MTEWLAIDCAYLPNWMGVSRVVASSPRPKPRPILATMRRPSARIVIVDDHPLVCESLRRRIEAERNLKVCGQSGDRHEALELVGNLRPDLVIVSLRLGAMWGVDLIYDLRMHQPKVAALVLSMFDSYFHAASAIRAGARGFITQHEAPKVIIPAIRQVLAGEIYLSAVLAQSAAARLTRSGKSGYTLGVDALSRRELQVFELAGIGFDTRRIAGTTGLDISTVDTYRARIKDKLQFQNAPEFLQAAIAWVHSQPTGLDKS